MGSMPSKLLNMGTNDIKENLNNYDNGEFFNNLGVSQFSFD